VRRVMLVERASRWVLWCALGPRRSRMRRGEVRRLETSEARGSCDCRSDGRGGADGAWWRRSCVAIAASRHAVAAANARRQTRRRGAVTLPRPGRSSDPATKRSARSSALRQAAASSNTRPELLAPGLVSVWRAAGFAKMLTRAGLTARAPPSAVVGVVAIAPQRGARRTWPPELQPTAEARTWRSTSVVRGAADRTDRTRTAAGSAHPPRLGLPLRPPRRGAAVRACAGRWRRRRRSR
jgi:hypothetical protein